MSRDAITGLAVLAASLVLFALTLGLQQNALVPIGPGFYPRIVLGISALLSAMLLFFSLREKTPEEKGRAAGTRNYKLVVTIFAIFGVYVGALPFLGYRVATFVFVAVLQALLEPPAGRKGWILLLVSALLTTAATYVLFEKYLTVLLPRGRWTDF